MPEPPARYSAFISYARTDERAAAWLQKRIEAYRLPRRLRGEGPARLPPVFRDRNDLSAGSDLSAALATALGESAWMIVVCTPAAVASRWVTREIELFRQQHGPDRILAALFEGDGDVAFPEGLRSADGGEPLAADFRPRGDGPRLGTLKLIAPIAGLRLDDLVHRDAVRRARQFGFAALAAALLAVALGVLAVAAVRARAAAEVQREKAEGLVEFMLTDLRKRLKSVGRLELLTAVNKRAISYYDGMDLARLPAESLERRAGLLHAMGEDDEKRGDLRLATREWQEARRTTAALLAARPRDPQRVFAHSQSEYWVGFAAWRAGDLRGAKEAFLSYARLTDELRRLQPGNLDYVMEQGYAFSNLGMFTLRGLGQGESAEGQLTKSLGAFEYVAHRRPGDVDTRVQIADAYGWIGDSRRVRGAIDPARTARAQQRAMIDRLLAADTSNVELRNDRVANVLASARIELAAGNPGGAAALIDRALPEATQLARLDPEDVEVNERLRMMRLVKVEAWLSMRKRPGLVEPAQWTAFCAAGKTVRGNEVVAWCRRLRAQLVPAEAAALLAADATDPALKVGRYSVHWGIDNAAGLSGNHDITQ